MMLPQHIAIIMDGNGRWARAKNQPRIFGHRAARKTVRRVVEHCAQLRIKALTLFAFSTENWKRPPDEVSMLMELFITTLKKEIDSLDENNIKLEVIGDISLFAANLQQEITKAEQRTANNSGMRLNVAANYGGRWDITQAVNKVLEDNRDSISEEDIARHLSLADQPEPDLFIRTGGEQRVSNFLLWQLAYTELYFTKVNWPDFSIEQLDLAIEHFAHRERRFGLTGEQIKKR